MYASSVSMSLTISDIKLIWISSMFMFCMKEVLPIKKSIFWSDPLGIARKLYQPKEGPYTIKQGEFKWCKSYSCETHQRCIQWCWKKIVLLPLLQTKMRWLKSTLNHVRRHNCLWCKTEKWATVATLDSFFSSNTIDSAAPKPRLTPCICPYKNGVNYTQRW